MSGPDGESEAGAVSLAEERLRLEREALAVERERLAAARARVEAAALLAKASHPRLVGVSVALLALLCFAGGLLTGVVVAERRQDRQREERLARALSHLDGIAGGTNAVPASAAGTAPVDEHRNVAVMVIQ